jgi:hypothetical protein
MLPKLPAGRAGMPIIPTLDGRYRESGMEHFEEYNVITDTETMGITAGKRFGTFYELVCNE